jgi:hypothetical protein
MATKRRGTKGRAASRRPAPKGTAGGGTAGKRKRGAGARRERRSAVAREVRVEAAGTGAAEVSAERPALRLAEPGSEPFAGDPFGAEAELSAREAAEAEREAAELSRRIEEKAGAVEDDLRRRTEAASTELGRRRAEQEAAAAREKERGLLPGARQIAFELALGAARLLRTLLIAPLRIALAFLWPREA